MQAELFFTDIRETDPDEREIRDLTSRLPSYFREKIKAARQNELKLSRLAAGYLLLYSLKERGIQTGDFIIADSPTGKPEALKPSGLYFNISHSDGLVLLCVADVCCGCDIQKIKSGGEKIAERFFRPEETRAIYEVPEEERDEYFTCLWTRKESYIKAVGEGMKLPLSSFSVLEDETPDGFYFSDYKTDGYLASLCLCEKGRAVDLCFCPFQNLVNVL